MNMVKQTMLLRRSASIAKHQGFTLVEIMLAITLSLILIAGVIQVYLSSKTSFHVQNELARLQENQRITIDFLERDILQAGFNIPIGMDPITIDDPVNGDNDSITIRYASATDCLGQDTPNGIAINRYFILTDAQGSRLVCDGNSVDDNGNDLASEPIADGITHMQILVGENTVDNATSTYSAQMPSADRYVKVGNADRSQVVSIRIAFLTQSEQEIRQQNVFTTFTLLDTTVGTDPTIARFKRQVVTTTIPLRNRTGI